MSAMSQEFRAIDIALKRMEKLNARARQLAPDCGKAERMALIADIDAAMRALRATQGELRGRIARTRRCRPVVTAYGRAANILSATRR